MVLVCFAASRLRVRPSFRERNGERVWADGGGSHEATKARRKGGEEWVGSVGGFSFGASCRGALRWSRRAHLAAMPLPAISNDPILVFSSYQETVS